MSHALGIFCVSVDGSVDGHEAEARSLAAVRRRELIELMERFDVPSNWTVQDNCQVELPSNAEITVGVPKSMARGDLVQHLKRMSAFLLRDRASLNSVVIDPHEARQHWDILIRQGCVVARPRRSDSTNDTDAKI